ncbi:EpsG family protein [Pantoea eucrina]|uniref:EpsG family protein n=1 Tax=Pantoea eucrina TaxID=472693 RepID=UPI000B8CDE07|nr:EpsG family protein [Pantoea eucrina]
MTQKKTCSLIVSKSLFFFCLFMFTLILIAGLRTPGLDNDSITYYSEVLNIYNGIYNIKEPVFLLFSYASEYLFNKNPEVIFLFYALLSITIKAYAIKNHSDNIYLSFIVYAGMFYILHEMTQIRVGLAAALYLLAIPDLVKSNKKSYILKVALATLCHFSAVILIPLMLFSPRKINKAFVFLCPFAALCFVLLIGDVNSLLIEVFKLLPEPLATKGITYTLGAQDFGRFDNVNIFSKFTLSAFSFFLIYIFCTYKKDELEAKDIIFLKLFSFMLTVFYLCSSVPVLASRSFELYAVSFIFSLPRIAAFFKPKFLAHLILSSWVFLYFYLVNLKLIGL